MVNRINFVLISAIAPLVEWVLLLFLRKDALVHGATPPSPEVSLSLPLLLFAGKSDTFGTLPPPHQSKQ
jgi:hypothetical protein